MGRIELIDGCMFSGKTTAMIRRVRAAEAAGRRVVVFKNGIDDRYAVGRVVAHSCESIEARPVTGSAEIPNGAAGADLVAIDEAHFFDDGLEEVCRQLAADGADILITALDRDIWGRPFPVVQALAELADHREHMLATCGRCGRPADHTQRVRPMAHTEDFVGGPESYEPRCTECFVPGPLDEPGSGTERV